MLGQGSQDFAVESDAFFLQGPDKFAVGNAFFVEGGVDFEIPKPSGDAFFVTAVGESVSPGVSQGLIGLALFGAAAETKTLHLAKDIPAGLQGVNSFFYSGHGGLY